jgi:hypothetical protein
MHRENFTSDADGPDAAGRVDGGLLAEPQAETASAQQMNASAATGLVRVRFRVFTDLLISCSG